VLRLKVSGISSLTDARYCAGMGVSYLSLVFDQSGITSLSSDEFHAIRPWIEGVKWLAEYQGSDLSIIRLIRESYRPDGWILPAGLSADEISEEIWSHLEVNQNSGRLPDGRLHLHFQSDLPENLRQILQENSMHSGPWMLENHLHPEEAMKLAADFPELVFSIRSGKEERPGWMDLGALQDYLEALEEF